MKKHRTLFSLVLALSGGAVAATETASFEFPRVFYDTQFPKQDYERKKAQAEEVRELALHILNRDRADILAYTCWTDKGETTEPFSTFPDASYYTCIAPIPLGDTLFTVRAMDIRQGFIAQAGDDDYLFINQPVLNNVGYDYRLNGHVDTGNEQNFMDAVRTLNTWYSQTD